MGGLLVLSTNFQESQRIANQLKGRAGRQVLKALPDHPHVLLTRLMTSCVTRLP